MYIETLTNFLSKLENNNNFYSNSLLAVVSPIVCLCVCQTLSESVILYSNQSVDVVSEFSDPI